MFINRSITGINKKDNPGFLHLVEETTVVSASDHNTDHCKWSVLQTSILVF